IAARLYSLNIIQTNTKLALAEDGGCRRNHSHFASLSTQASIFSFDCFVLWKFSCKFELEIEIGKPKQAQVRSIEEEIMRLLIHLIPFLSLFPALFSSLLALSQTTCSPHHTNDNDDNSSLCQPHLIIFSLRIDGMTQKKKIQNLLTWCLSSVEGNDESILSWSFCGLANNKGWGLTVTLGVPKVKPEVTAHYGIFLTGRTLKGSLFGGWKPKSDLPSLVDMYTKKVRMVISSNLFGFLPKVAEITPSPSLLLFEKLLVAQTTAAKSNNGNSRSSFWLGLSFIFCRQRKSMHSFPNVILCSLHATETYKNNYNIYLQKVRCQQFHIN
ncbi:unnamed protein product, partial [Prunus brigantina]